MSPLEIGRPPRRAGFFRNIFIVMMIVGVVIGGYFVVPKFEWKAPQIKITPDVDTLGIAPIEIDVTEQGSGLKSIAVSLSANGTEYPLVSEQYEQPVMQKHLSVALAAKLAGVKEGPAVLRVNARDRSWWSFFRGNETALQKNVTIDITPPTIELIADDR